MASEASKNVYLITATMYLESARHSFVTCLEFLPATCPQQVGTHVQETAFGY